MSSRTLVGGGFELEDANGSFARFLRNAPKEFRQSINAAIKTTCFALERRMESAAPVGPDAPHIKEAVTHAVRGLSGRVGYIDATAPAAPGSNASIADVALYNEYRPNKQPFMRPSAELEASDYVRRMKAAIGQAERSLSGGSGNL